MLMDVTHYCVSDFAENTRVPFLFSFSTIGAARGCVCGRSPFSTRNTPLCSYHFFYHLGRHFLFGCIHNHLVHWSDMSRRRFFFRT